MKKILNYKHILFALMMCMAVVSCNKFEVLKNIDPDLVDAGTNLKTMSIWEFISDRNLVNKGADTLKSLDLYAAAIERVGLRPLLEGDGDFTVIAPRNEALKQLAINLKYATVEEIPAALLRNIFLDNIISKRVNSFDIAPNAVNVFPTLNEDSLPVLRLASNTDKYLLGLYISPTSTNSVVQVRSQNLACKNGIVHVVDDFKAFAPKYNLADPAKVSGDTILVTKDAYLTNGSGSQKDANYGDLDIIDIKKSTSASFTKRGILQFPVRAPSKFTDPIAGVTMYLYSSRFDPPSGGTSATLSIYEAANVDFNEVRTDPNDATTGVNWRNAPEEGSTELSHIDFKRPAGADTVYSASIGDNYKAALTSGKTFINIGLNTTANALFRVGTKETVLDANGQSGRFLGAFIVLTPATPTKLIDPVNTGLVVDLKKGYKKINTSELSFSGTESRNVIYTIESKPVNGFLVVNGTPNVLGFTQAQLEKGAVKYLYSGDAPGSDSFIVSAKDSEGNAFATSQVVNVQIQ